MGRKGDTRVQFGPARSSSLNVNVHDQLNLICQRGVSVLELVDSRLQADLLQQADLRQQIQWYQPSQDRHTGMTVPVASTGNRLVECVVRLFEGSLQHSVSLLGSMRQLLDDVILQSAQLLKTDQLSAPLSPSHFNRDGPPWDGPPWDSPLETELETARQQLSIAEHSIKHKSEMVEAFRAKLMTQEEELARLRRRVQELLNHADHQSVIVRAKEREIGMLSRELTKVHKGNAVPALRSAGDGHTGPSPPSPPSPSLRPAMRRPNK